MRKYPFFQVDAFTQEALSGNACAVVFDADGLDSKTMLAIAREFNLSETAFVLKGTEADFDVRYFTPDEEIPLAGHPTIATSKALVASGRFDFKGEKAVLKLGLQVGVIRVELHALASGELGRIDMFQKKPSFHQVYQPKSVVDAFGLELEDLLPNAIIQTVSTGTKQLMVPLKNLAALRKAMLHVPSYLKLKQDGDFFSPHLFCLEGVTKKGDTFARHFGTPPDVFEDPFTGSATGGMAAYLWHYGYLDNPAFIAEQGHDMRRPGRADVKVIGPRAEIESVRVGGHAVVVMEGNLFF